jgi:hypothetical protein
LIINLPVIRPVAEASTEAEDMSFRQAPAIIVALTPPPLAPGFSDAPRDLVMRMALGFVFARRQIFTPPRRVMIAAPALTRSSV